MELAIESALSASVIIICETIGGQQMWPLGDAGFSPARPMNVLCGLSKDTLSLYFLFGNPSSNFESSPCILKKARWG